MSLVTPHLKPDFISTQVSDSQHYFFDRDHLDDGLTIICGGYEKLRSDYLINRDTFPYWVIEYIVEGAGTVVLNGTSYQLSAGMAFAYRPNMPHIIQSDPMRPMAKYYLTFSGERAEAIVSESILGSWSVHQLSLSQEISDAFEIIQREASSGGDRSHKMCVLLLEFLLIKISAHALHGESGEGRSMETYLRAKRTIHQNYAVLRSAQDAAQLCHVNHCYLGRLFKRYSDTTPYQLILKLKMNRASEMLLDHGMMVKQVAHELGFADAYHFSHAFKRMYGVSPDHFVKQKVLDIQMGKPKG